MSIYATINFYNKRVSATTYADRQRYKRLSSYCDLLEEVTGVSRSFWHNEWQSGNPIISDYLDDVDGFAENDFRDARIKIENDFRTLENADQNWYHHG